MGYGGAYSLHRVCILVYGFVSSILLFKCRLCSFNLLSSSHDRVPSRLALFDSAAKVITGSG